ncbi:hypothetical protein LGN19_23315 [Burkholderia sp. AU30198]|uniref:cysteine protease StiP domain-containing protein n=1 Tax=Burkholderia sp. AU30198 TaxID=2879627 RepID=UPI001CF2EF9E|nr:cysteine protease StiP domain-containing protein [Burkholderia sp. AU30198]MCA8296729.1 hypothetical protein [Burkholderia sp. AU30198]
MGNLLASLSTVGSGSYAPEDVHFLLRHVRMSVTSVEEKERLIQTNQKHYSEMIGLEHAPNILERAKWHGVRPAVPSSDEHGVRLAEAS